MQERQPPRVTVRDPSRPARPADVLASGDDRPPRPSPFTPRRLKAAAAVLLVLGAVAGAVELRERRAAAAEERRLDRVIDLAVEPRSSSSSYDQTTRSVTLDLQLRLRNDGPRLLAVERARAGGYVLVQVLVELRAGDAVPLLLRRQVTCSATPPPPEPLEALVLDLRTAAGPRTVELPLDPSLLTDEAPRACGFLPLEEAVDVDLRGARRDERGVRLVLELSNASVRDVTLTALDAGPGLSVSGVRFPLRLPAAPPAGPRTTPVELVLSVGDCTAARQARSQVLLQLRDDRGRVAQPVVGYDPVLLSALLADSCSG